MLTAILELDSRAGDEVFHRAGNKHLSRFGEGRDPRADVDCDSAGLAVHEFALAGMQTRAYLQVEVADALADSEGAADRPRRAVEGGEEAVAGGVHLLAAETPQLRADDLVMLLQKLPP